MKKPKIKVRSDGYGISVNDTEVAVEINKDAIETFLQSRSKTKSAVEQQNEALLKIYKAAQSWQKGINEPLPVVANLEQAVFEALFDYEDLSEKQE